MFEENNDLFSELNRSFLPSKEVSIGNLNKNSLRASFDDKAYKNKNSLRASFDDRIQDS